jgi:hypothetical protein
MAVTTYIETAERIAAQGDGQAPMRPAGLDLMARPELPPRNPVEEHELRLAHRSVDQSPESSDDLLVDRDTSRLKIVQRLAPVPPLVVRRHEERTRLPPVLGLCSGINPAHVASLKVSEVSE